MRKLRNPSTRTCICCRAI